MKLVRLTTSPALVLVLALAASPMLSAAPASQPPPPEPDTIDLKTAIGYALENNFAIRQARERIREQEGVIVEVRARAIPTVNATGSAQVNDKAVSSYNPASDHAWSVGITASQLLYSGGGVRSAIHSAQLLREAATLDLKDSINSALLQVRTAYYQVLLAREKITVQEENLRLLQEQLKTTTDRFDAGTVSGFEKLRAEVAVANAKTPLITARNDYRLAIEALRQSLGLSARQSDSLEKAPNVVGALDYKAETFDLASAFGSAHANRPDVLRLSKLVEANQEGVTIANSGYKPTVEVVAAWDARGGFAGRSFGSSSSGALAGVQTNWAIFDGLATRGRVIQARSAVEQSRLNLSQAELAAEVDVRRAYSSWQEATELVDASQKVVDQAQEAVRLANARYTAGTGTQLDVLQAQVDLTTARTNQVQAFYTYNVAVADLRRAMGLSDALVTE
jgi:outer membrane protein TolC